jgi:hypothetical protein
MRRTVLKAGACTSALSACVLAGAVATAAGKKETSAEKPAPTALSSGESGLVVVRDKESGELRAPEPGEAAELMEQAVPADNYSDEGLVQEPLPRGGYTMDLKGRFQEYFVVVRGANGALQPRCVNNPALVGLAPASGAPAAAPAAQGEDR